jgi:hypothetical protein
MQLMLESSFFFLECKITNYSLVTRDVSLGLMVIINEVLDLGCEILYGVHHNIPTHSVWFIYFRC